MKKVLALLLTLTLMMGIIVGCGQSSKAPAEAETPKTEAPAKDKIVCGVVLIDMTNQFFVDMIEGGNKAAEDYGCEVIWKSADGNFDNEISLMENFIEQGVDCILVDPLDSEGLKPTIEKASAAGIPTITMAGKVDVDTN